MKMGLLKKYEPKIAGTFVFLFIFSNILVEICAAVDNIGISNRRHDAVKRNSKRWRKKEGMIILTHGKTNYEGG